VEREIAGRLRAGGREERRALYRTMYDELFARVPDHPRLKKSATPELTRRSVAHKLRFVGRFLDPSQVVVEFAPGDCRFAFEMTKRVRKVYGVDISDQIGAGAAPPDNFELIVYDGFELDLPGESVDFVFSDQFLEHLHPEDTEHHLRLVHRLLRPGGSYAFRTPNRHSGPHDVSRYFCDEPEGFHLKEWTTRELAALLRRVGYRRVRSFWLFKRRYFEIPPGALGLLEGFVGALPHALRRRLAKYLVRAVSLVAYK
jgi:SAM-dependent methyltransferase